MNRHSKSLNNGKRFQFITSISFLIYVIALMSLFAFLRLIDNLYPIEIEHFVFTLKEWRTVHWGLFWLAIFLSLGVSARLSAAAVLRLIVQYNFKHRRAIDDIFRAVNDDDEKFKEIPPYSVHLFIGGLILLFTCLFLLDYLVPIEMTQTASSMRLQFVDCGLLWLGVFAIIAWGAWSAAIYKHLFAEARAHYLNKKL